MSRGTVLHLTPALFGPAGGVFGGAERYTFELARHMARRVPTRLVTFADRPQSFTTPDKLHVEVLGPMWRVRGQEFNRFHPRLIREIASAEVIHCHQTRMFASGFTALLGRLAGKTVFASDLGGGGWDFSTYFNTDGWFRGHLHISEYSRNQAEHANWERARVIFGGVDTSFFSPDPSVPKEPLVVFVGRLMAHKGIHDLVAALPDGLDLELIGRPYQPDYLNLLTKLAIGKRVRFRHNCSDEEIVQAYRRAVAVVLPSVYRDAYGNDSKVPELLGQTPLEGMSCGTPAVVTSVASLPEVVEEGVTGFCVPPNDPAALRSKLEALRDDSELVTRMGRAGRERVLCRFRWDAVVERCLNAYGISAPASSRIASCQ